MSNRDDFSQKTKNSLAARAGWQCSFSGCTQSTHGPSAESPGAVSNIGVAAHICAAAPGPGARRYDETMSREERSGIGNAIWLCANHATLIDRDEVRYPPNILRAMKAERERASEEEQLVGKGTGLFAIGPDIVFTGEFVQVTAGSWTLNLKHFVAGDRHLLIGLINSFASRAAEDRYVLSSELGDGRVLSGAPTLKKQASEQILTCPVAPSALRIDAQQLGKGLALDPKTHDIFLSGGSIAWDSGVDYLPQIIQSLLSMQRGENVFAATEGMRFFEYFAEFSGTVWLSRLLMLDVIRQAAIPATDLTVDAPPSTPLRCVTRVHNVEMLSEIPENHRLHLRVDLDVQGVGRWPRELSIYMPTSEQMRERAYLLK